MKSDEIRMRIKPFFQTRFITEIPENRRYRVFKRLSGAALHLMQRRELSISVCIVSHPCKVLYNICINTNTLLMRVL